MTAWRDVTGMTCLAYADRCPAARYVNRSITLARHRGPWVSSSFLQNYEIINVKKCQQNPRSCGIAHDIVQNICEIPRNVHRKWWNVRKLFITFSKNSGARTGSTSTSSWSTPCAGATASPRWTPAAPAAAGRPRSDSRWRVHPYNENSVKNAKCCDMP